MLPHAGASLRFLTLLAACFSVSVHCALRLLGLSRPIGRCSSGLAVTRCHAAAGYLEALCLDCKGPGQVPN
jgi:hypothetical protein